MRIVNSEQSVHVAKKLSFFIKESLDLTSDQMGTLSPSKRLQIAAKLSDSPEMEYTTLDLGPDKSPEDATINQLIARKLFFEAILQDVEKCVDGKAVKDILSEPDHVGRRVLGNDLKEVASNVFSDTPVGKVSGSNEASIFLAQITAWEDLEDLTKVYYEAGKRVAPNADYHPMPELVEYIQSATGLLATQIRDLPSP